MKQAPKQKQMRYDDLRKAKQKLIEEYGSITYQELTLHDLRAFINLDVNWGKDVVSLHSHMFYEVLFCRQGNVDYLLDNQRFRVQQGDIVLIPPGMGHRPLFLEELKEPYVRYALWIDAAFFKGACAQYPLLDLCFQQCRKRGSYLRRTTRASWVGLQAAFDSLHREAEEQQPCWELCLAMGALTLMTHISRTYYYQDSAAPAAESNTLLDQMFQYIDNHLGEKITLEDVARQCMVSKSTVSHVFREKLGVPFYQCLVQRRLAAAKKSMLRGQPLRQVCEECGFADYSSFYRLFKKEHGISPRQFLELHRQVAQEETPML